MVNFTKWVIIAAGLVFLGLFTQEAAATGLTGTLRRTGLSGQTVGTGIKGVGTGIGGFFVEMLKPLWEIKNIVSAFMNLGQMGFPSGQGGGTNEGTGEGGGSDPIPVTIIQGSPDVYTSTGFSYYTPSWGGPPVTDAIVHGHNMPLSAESVAYYESLGVSVEVNPDGGGIHTSSGGGGGISNSSSSSGGNPLAAAHAAGYSLGSA